MKKLLILIFVATTNISYAQVFCSYSGGSCAIGLMNSPPYVTNIVNTICSSLNVNPIRVYEGNVGNACASTYFGRPIITYNSQFMNYLFNHNKWAPISVLAHEVGHHFNRDLSWYGSFRHSWTKELQADFISGYVLYKMGATLENAKSAFYILFDWMGTSSHPDTPKRIDALTRGYFKAANEY